MIGTYRLDALLGSGGMGAVYRGLDLMLDRPVAVKALRAEVAAQPHLVERFRQEARTLARLLHPNIATLYTLVRDGDDHYMVMEFCEGETFESILRRRGRLDPAEALPLYTQALDGLAHAHRHGIVHRDIKPANLMRLPNGTVKVMDFGIARLLGSARLTQTRHTVGTAEYMAPEQIRSQDVDARADVYALGVLLYELLTGRVPFESDSFFEVMQAHLQDEPPPPRQFAPAMPEALEAVILRALAKAPADRFPSVDALRVALDAIELPSAPHPTPKATVVAPSPALGSTEADEADASKKRKSRRKKPAESAPAAVAASVGSPAEPVLLDPDATQPTPTILAPRPTDDARATVAAPAPTAISPGPPAAAARPATEDTPEVTAPAWKRFAPRAALVAGALGLVLAMGVWALSPGPPPPPPEEETAGTTASEFAGGGMLPPIATELPPRPTPSTIPTAPSSVAAWIATARALLDAGALTTPADSNALLFAERALAASPGNPDARAVIRDVVRRYVGMGGRAQQRGNLSAARSHYQQAVAVADRHPGVADDVRASARSGLTAVSAAASLAAQDGPGERRGSVPNADERSREAPATGTVRVLVRPFGDVYVDGQKRASGTNAPVLAEVAPGTHRIRVTHPEFGSQERSVTVASGRTAEVFIEFATPAQVTVVSDPVNAEILLDGRSTGRYTPATITIPPGRHTVEVRRDGHRSASRSVSIEAGRAPERLTFTLTPEH